MSVGSSEFLNERGCECVCQCVPLCLMESLQLPEREAWREETEP